ncbi:nucleoside diphosphate-linked moiety X motif 17-like [Pomacea canaliculata]|uniref:nucleoside diphosphate-linked moiety X motif 17-like n=1 Tax=Pomacea canaliculata TaxID=400727 RepID=UPI000D72CD23|nr:nucleoside diphosphate-linked moiety X motif 17-like [Pomacea canaliculata]
MASVRILACIQRRGKDQAPRLASFTECVVDYFEEADGKAQVSVQLVDDKLLITDSPSESCQLFIKHPPFCPVKSLSPEQAADLPLSTHQRGINTGAAVILESADGKILLTKRAPHLHTFPGIWVPPGGHIEQNETLSQTGLRELFEETGLRLTEEDCVGEQLLPLALWESVYPPKLSLGAPARHHVVVYLYAKLKSPLTSERLLKEVIIDPNEVAACVWLDREIVSAIVNQSEESGCTKDLDSTMMPDTLRALVLDDTTEAGGSHHSFGAILAMFWGH